MDWYYVEGGKSVGPVPEDQLVQLIRSGKVSRGTLVWCQGMSEWKPAHEAGPAAVAAPASVEGAQVCAHCGNSFPQEEMMRFENSWVCVNCKPVFLQKLKEGVKISSSMVYGGFWIRFGAKIIDGILLQIINYILILPLFALTGFKDPAVFGVIWVIQIIVSMLVPIAITTFFLGKYGATPGKMACRLKVVTPEGGKITYLRAFARYWAEMISSLTMAIGYLIAAWDEEKRALHDRICNTRVIRSV